MNRKITLDVSLDDFQLEKLKDIIKGNNGLDDLDLNSDEDLKKICSACLTCGIITEAQKARERRKGAE